MRWFSKKRNFIPMVLPSFVLYTLYVIIPLFIAFYYSLTEYSGIGKAEYIGADNYDYLFSDPVFWVSVKNTAVIFVIALAVLLPGSLCLALALNKKFKFANLAKALNFTPNVIAPILVGLIWVFILDPKIGLINAALRAAGLDGWQQQWIGGTVLTPYCVGLIYVWQNIGFYATIFLAGLKMIPGELLESCRIDGGNSWQQFRYITLPLLKETLAINTILIITGCFKIFETVYQLTNGSPNHLSEVLITYMYNTTFIEGKYGYGMSIAVVTCSVTMVFSFIYLFIINRGQED